MDNTSKHHKEEILMLHKVINQYKKEINILKSANSMMADENIKLRSNIIESTYYITFDNEDELAKYVEDCIDKYIISGHIKSTITDDFDQ